MQFLSVCPRNMKGFQNPHVISHSSPSRGHGPPRSLHSHDRHFGGCSVSQTAPQAACSGYGLLAGATSAMATPRLVAARGTSLWQPPRNWMLILSQLISSCLPATQGLWGRGTRGQSPAHLWVRSSWVCACRWQLGTQSSSPGAWKRTAGHYQPFLFFQLFMAYKGNVTWIPSQSVAMHLPEKL